MSDHPLYLCLDQGGHASRALVFDGRGMLVARAVVEVATHRPAPQHVEQDADAVVDSLTQAIAAVASTLGARVHEIVGAGMATQRSSIVCWDRVSGEALSPLISWQDRRAHAWIERHAEYAKDISRITGLRLSPHYGVSKLRWCLDRLPSVKAAYRAQRLVIGPLASFLAFRLLRERPCCVDPANAQRLLLLNLSTQTWDERLLQLFDVPPEILPTCAPTEHHFGHLRFAGRDIPLTVLTGDQSAALYALGAPREDVGYVNVGTGAFTQRIIREPRHVENLLTSVVHGGATNEYTLEGTVNGAGAALAWARENLGAPDLERSLPTWLDEVVAPPLFLNGIGGLGAPYWAPDFSSRFVGDGDVRQRAVAVAESIVFLLAANHEYLNTTCTPASALTVTGGLSNVDGICQRIADICGVSAWRPVEHEATARGVAFLLAGRPAEWASSDGAWFMPARNPDLLARYQRWRTALEAAL